MEKLTASQVSAQRAKMLEEQGGLCLLCCDRIEVSEAVLDHCHASGHCRGVLHRGCNSMLGVIENNRPRYMLRGPRLFAMLERVEKYLAMDATAHPVHHTFKTAEQKRLAVNAKARKARAAKKPTT